MSESNLEGNLGSSDSLKSLSERLSEKMVGNSEIVEVSIPFTNNDVPEYLAMLRKFSEASRKTELMIGYKAVSC